MKRTTLICCALAVIIAGFFVFDIPSVMRYAKIQERLADPALDEEKMLALIPLLDREIVARPDDMLLVHNRMSILMRLGKPEDAYRDADTLYRRFPSPDTLLATCLIAESMEVPSEEYMACYTEVFSQTAGRTDTDGEFLHIYAALMAERPEADELRAAYLERYRAVPEQEIFRDILEHFEREKQPLFTPYAP